MIEIVGYLGAFCLGICAAPQAWQSYKTKSSEGINCLFLGLWLLGEVLTLSYILIKYGLDIPLTLNYTFNIVLILIILRYKSWQ